MKGWRAINKTLEIIHIVPNCIVPDFPLACWMPESYSSPPVWPRNCTQHGGAQKMSLESYSQEARRLLASFLSSLLDALGHWYAPMLPDDHPSSFVSLMAWLQASLLCHSCPGSLRFCHEAGQKQEFIQFPEWCLQWLPSIPTPTFDQ
jgi:hypothetical protein